MAKWDPARQIWPTLSKVNINGECSGRPYGPLVETIKTAEALFGWKMDGRVTPIAKSAKFSHMGINYVYLIMIMNIALSKMYPQQYPRLDQFPEFIWRVRDKVTYPFVY
jgi:hypothetical protein